jgi:hypothetical protein
MVWVWPPHTSMNLYWRPGWHRAAIWAASAWAFSASRNSSTKRTAAASSRYSILESARAASSSA